MDNTSTVREYEGTYGYAKVFSSLVEEAAEQQILTLLNQPMFENSTIRIMPDVHAGAGRIMGRKEAKRRLDMDEFRAVMKEHGVRSSCVSEETLDEAPMAYKDPSAILQCVGDTAEVVHP